MSVRSRLRRDYRQNVSAPRALLIVVVALLSLPTPITSAEVAKAATPPNVFLIPDPNAAFAFDGSAFGHGVGLCQWGARGRAASGQSAQQIIGTYYPGTVIQKVLAPETTIRVLVHSGLDVAADEIERVSAISGTWQVVAQGLPPISMPHDAKLELSNPGGLRWQVKLRDGTVLGWGPFSGPLVVRPTSAETRIVLDFRPSGDVPGRPNTYFDTYRGEIILYPTGQGIDTVNRLGIEDYLRGVVPEESPASWPDAALQAQALAARSYAVFRAQSRAKHVWDVDDSTWDQVYRGWWAEHPNTNRAIDATAGQLVMSGAQVAQTYYFASCNGWTDSNENVWGGTPLPYLRGIRDVDAAGQPFDKDAPGSIWTTGSLTVAQFEAMLKADPATDVGSLRSIDLSARAPSGRLLTVKVIGTNGTKVTAPETLQARFNRLRPVGVKPLLSTNFNVRWTTAEAVRQTQTNATAVAVKPTPRPRLSGNMTIQNGASNIFTLPGVNLLAPTGAAAPAGPVVATTPTPVPTAVPAPTRYDLTAPMPARPVGLTNQYFPETGHNVGGAFLNFFVTYGGLDMFGMPRTEELLEDGRTVQYFQRARLEFAVEKAGTSYEVQPALLGDVVTEGRRPFPKSPVFDSTPGHQYFPETGHGLHNAFHRHWTDHGGLDLFGYPTSEEMDENGVIVQYFQRARLEYRADMPEGRRVSLGLIGDEYLSRRGWLPPPE
jgi:stage II sporulation protein D